MSGAVSWVVVLHWVVPVPLSLLDQASRVRVVAFEGETAAASVHRVAVGPAAGQGDFLRAEAPAAVSSCKRSVPGPQQAVRCDHLQWRCRPHPEEHAEEVVIAAARLVLEVALPLAHPRGVRALMLGGPAIPTHVESTNWQVWCQVRDTVCVCVCVCVCRGLCAGRSYTVLDEHRPAGLVDELGPLKSPQRRIGSYSVRRSRALEETAGRRKGSLR